MNGRVDQRFDVEMGPGGAGQQVHTSSSHADVLDGPGNIFFYLEILSQQDLPLSSALGARMKGA